MSDNPCHHRCDCADGDVTDLEDAGCCHSAPIRIKCDAPVLPTTECGETGMVTIFNEENETFSILTTLYDEQCSPISDQNNSPILTLIG